MEQAAGSGPGGSPDDATLTAYLDGELDTAARAAVDARLAAEPSLRLRLAALRCGGRDFPAAFDVLLGAAPAERLQAMLADVQQRAASTGPARRRPWRLAAMAAAVALFVVGAGTGYAISVLRPPEPPGWRQVVAEYQSLTTAETLAAIPDNPAFVSAEVAVAGAKLALPLDVERLMLPDASLKRAQMYEFRGRPLAQFAYLAPDGPVALCIIRNGRPDADFAFEEREGSNIVYWTRGGLGYMIIGRTPRETLEAYASDLAGRIS